MCACACIACAVIMWLVLKVHESGQAAQWARLLFKCIKPSPDTDFSLSGNMGMGLLTHLHYHPIHLPSSTSHPTSHLSLSLPLSLYFSSLTSSFPMPTHSPLTLYHSCIPYHSPSLLWCCSHCSHPYHYSALGHDPAEPTRGQAMLHTCRPHQVLQPWSDCGGDSGSSHEVIISQEFRTEHKDRRLACGQCQCVLNVVLWCWCGVVMLLVCCCDV